MKPLLPPHVPGNTDAERMDNALRRFFRVSKTDYDKAEVHRKKRPGKKRQKKH